MRTRQCELGITYEEIEHALKDRTQEFYNWMDGQTMALCPEHGGVVYPWDLQRFISGLPLID